MSRKVSLAAAAVVLAALTSAETASAQVNCNVLPHGQARANCYGRVAQIYREQSQNYNAIANQQYRMHQQVGAALRAAPLIGRYAAPAWNAPRYAYNGYQFYRGRR